jgi:hypothetical protein
MPADIEGAECPQITEALQSTGNVYVSVFNVLAAPFRLMR